MRRNYIKGFIKRAYYVINNLDIYKGVINPPGAENTG